MAGKKNHIIPKWMQKGFASRTDGEEILTWWFYRQKSTPIENKTGNIIAENYFYGKEGSLNADLEMTDAETNKFSPLFNKLRDGNCNFEESKTEIAELIAHFSIRTKVIRKGFEKMSEQMLGGIKEIITDEQVLNRLFLNIPKSAIKEQMDIVLSDPKYAEMLEPAMQIFEMLGISTDEVKDIGAALTISHLENQENRNEVKEIIQSKFGETIEKSVNLVPNSIKEGHIKSLAENTIPLPRVEKYKQLGWKVYQVDSSLILGDVACVFREVGEKSFKPSCDLDKTGQIYLPISSNQILIGTVEAEEIETDVKNLNKAFARCSYEQFICCEKSGDKIDLIQLIGTNAYLADNEEVEKGLMEIREEIENFHNENKK